MRVRVRIRSGRDYFSIVRQEGGRKIEKGLGSAPEWTMEKAEVKLRELQGSVPGKSPVSFNPGRAASVDESSRLPQKSSGPPEKDSSLLFRDAFERFYDYASTYKASWRDDRGKYHNHLKDTLGHLPLGMIRVATIEELKLKLMAKRLSPATQTRVLALVRVVFNHVIRLELHEGTNPVSKVKMPKVNNARLRYLTRDEAELLLDSCTQGSTASPELHDIVLLSLYSGMRLGECLGLLWSDVDLERGTITIRDSKNGSSRVVFMHPRVKGMLNERPRGVGEAKPLGKIFRNHPHTVTHRFKRVVDSLGLNDGIDDVRQRVVFHTLRHTFCSWQAEMGTSIQVIKELAGHKTLAMTMRYSHLSDQTLRAAVSAM